MTTPFDFINSITYSKRNLLEEDPQSIKEYEPFIVNKGLSYFPDTIMYANEMNKRWHVPKEWQFHYFLNTVSKKKRFSKWFKQEKDHANFSLVKEYFNLSDHKTRDALQVLTESQIEVIKEKLYKGGK